MLKSEIALLRVPNVVFEEYTVIKADECVGRIVHSFGFGQLEWLWIIAISIHPTPGDHGRSDSREACKRAFIAAWPAVVALVPQRDRNAHRLRPGSIRWMH